MVPSRHRVSFSAWFFKKQPSGRQILKSALNSDVRRQHAEDTSPSICISAPNPALPPNPSPSPQDCSKCNYVATISIIDRTKSCRSCVVFVASGNCRSKKTASLVCPQRLESMLFHLYGYMGVRGYPAIYKKVQLPGIF